MLSDGIEEWMLLPDWDSVRLCAYRDTHAAVQCFLAQMGLEDPFARCPRHLLSGVVEKLESGSESPWVRFEIEFCYSTEIKMLRDRWTRLWDAA